MGVKASLVGKVGNPVFFLRIPNIFFVAKGAQVGNPVFFL